MNALDNERRRLVSIAYLRIALSGLLAFGVLAPAEAATHPRPLPQRNISRGLVTRPATSRAFPAAKGTPHRFFGTITQVNLTTIVMLRRNGLTQVVDTTGVLQSGQYSAPLFVGKAIGVVGTIATPKGPMFATDIERFTRIDNVDRLNDQ